MPGQVPDQVIKARAKQLRELGDKKKREFLERLKGCILQVLAETCSDGIVFGTGQNYVRAGFPGPESCIGSIVTVRVEAAHADHVVGASSGSREPMAGKEKNIPPDSGRSRQHQKTHGRCG